MNENPINQNLDSEERLRLLTDNLPHSYLFQFTIHPHGQSEFIYVSSGVFAIHGISAEQIMADASLLTQQTDPQFVVEMEKAQAKSQLLLTDFHIEVRIKNRAGQWRWLEIRSRPRLTESGQVIWDGVATDITAMHEQKAILNHMARRSDVLLGLPMLQEGLEEKEFMQQVLNLLEKLTDSKIGFMHFVNEDQESIELIAWSSNTESDYCEAGYDAHYPISQAGIWADAARLREPLIVNDYANAPGKKGLPSGHCNLQRLLSVPVMDGGAVRMLTGVGNKDTAYTDLDVETLELIGNETWRIVTKRRIENALRIASQVVNASPVVCFRWRAEANWPVEFVSDNITQWGYNKQDILAGRPSFAEMVHPEDLPRIVEEVSQHTAAGNNTYVQEYRLLTGDGRVIWVEDHTIVQRDRDNQVRFYDGLVNDVTERRKRQEKMDKALFTQRQLNKRLEEAHNQLLQSEKMASIGQLAAGIAHELNNPIGFVHSNMGTLDSYLHDLMDILDAYAAQTDALGEAAPERGKIEQLKTERDFAYMREDIFNLLKESKEGLGRVRKIVQDLKNFSHVGEHEWQPADIHQGLDSTLNIVWNELKYKCIVVKEYGELPKVHCLISQLNQVFMNLLVNAGQAIENQGEIHIRTALHGEDSVLIEISDSGKGISPEHLNRIFEPFFTTKPVGKGTGLGLSLSYGIIQRHHGRIEVDSEVGKGTRFRVIIPIEQTNTAPAPENTEISS